MAERVLATVTGSKTPKEELETSMEVLERETKRIRLEQSVKIRKSTREEMTMRSNDRPLVITGRDRKIPSIYVLETKYEPQVVEEATLGSPAKLALVPVVVRKAVPVRDFLTIGSWGW